MKKILVLLVLFLSFSLSATEFDFGVGGNIDVKDSVTSFMVMPSIGGKYVRFGLGYQVGSTLGVTVQGLAPRLFLEYPVEFELSNGGLWSIGPMFDLGPTFWFVAGVKIINFMDLGFGGRLKYYFNDHIGLALVPVHFTFNFASWGSGGLGTATGLSIVYDIFVSFIYKW